MKNILFLIGLLLVAVGIFEFHPAVEYWRVVIPEEIYVGKDCGCDCILESRPWYSRFNYWFWLWVIATPVVVFSVKPAAPRWQRTIRTVVAICFCYGIMNLALHLMWDIRNGPFWVIDGYPWQKSWDDPGTKCVSSGTGASLVFTLFFGWIYATIYTGWWELLWYRYHKRRTGLIDESFKRDILTRIVVFISYLVAKLILFVIIALPFAVAGYYILEWLDMLEGLRSLLF